MLFDYLHFRNIKYFFIDSLFLIALRLAADKTSKVLIAIKNVAVNV